MALHTQTLQVTQCVGHFKWLYSQRAGITAKTNIRDVRLTDVALHLPGRKLQGQRERLSKPTAGSLWLLECHKWAYLPEPAIPDLFKVEETVAAEICGFQELDWRKRREETVLHWWIILQHQTLDDVVVAFTKPVLRHALAHLFQITLRCVTANYHDNVSEMWLYFVQLLQAAIGSHSLL